MPELKTNVVKKKYTLYYKAKRDVLVSEDVWAESKDAAIAKAPKEAKNIYVKEVEET